MNSPVFSVGELNQYVKSLLDSEPALRGISVRGELSNYKTYPSGHHYFSIKDAQAAVSCVMFRGSASKLRFRPENGMKVTIVGNATLYPASGTFQLYVTSIMPEGAGDLQVAFEQLKEKLEKEGLFDLSHKKPLPVFPERIAVITSGAGAAVHDVIRVLGHRWPMAKVLVMPVSVQGAEAPPQIVGAIRYANQYHVADLIITGRGGGSMEDLWAFNDERVARAIFASDIPVISAVGHEPDVTISDYVADRRAATPSNAAEIAVQDAEDMKEAVQHYSIRMRQAMQKKLEYNAGRLKDLAERPVLIDPAVYLGTLRMRLDMLSGAFLSAQEKKLAGLRADFSSKSAKLDALSPLKVIARGYAVAEKDGVILRSVEDAAVGDAICVKMTDGILGCTIEEIIHGTEENGTVV